MTDSCHLENRQIAIYPDSAEQVSSVLAVRRLEFLKWNLLWAAHLRHMFCIIMQNFVEIGRTVAEIS